MSDDPVRTAQVGLPRGFQQIPQTGIGTYSLTIQLTVLPPLVATPNPIYGAGTLGLALASVDNTYLAPMLLPGLKGSLSSAPSQPQDLSVAQVTTLLGGPFLTSTTGSVGNINLTPAPAQTLKGNNTGASGPVLDMTGAQANTLIGGPFLTASSGSVGTTNLTDGSVTNAKLAALPAQTLHGDNTAGSGPVLNLTVAQTNTLLGGPFLPTAGGSVGAVTTTGLLTINSNATVVGAASTLTVGGKVGFNGAAASAKIVVSGSRGGNAALLSLLTALVTFGLITDSTTA
jgi:hypothetical protein